MDTEIIAGRTRTLGEAQGYIPLAIRDVVMNDQETGMNFPVMQSWWKPTADELDRLNEGQPVLLTVLGGEHPPVMMNVEAIS